MTKVINKNTCNEIIRLIFEMTNKQYKNVEENQLRQLYQICVDSEVHVSRIFSILMDNMKKPHSEVRFNTFYIFAKLFRRNQCFRNFAVENMKNVLDLIVGTNRDLQLPPPKTAAEELKRYFFTCMKNWVDEYGSTFCKLKLCYEFLKRKQHVDFQKLEIESRASKQKREEMKLKKQKFVEEKLRKLKNEIYESQLEIKASINALKSCLHMLVPTPEEFFLLDEAGVHNEFRNNINNETMRHVETNESLRETGILHGGIPVSFSISENRNVVRIVENYDNSVIIENAKDQYRLLGTKYLNLIKNWIKQLTLLAVRNNELKEIIDLKNDVENIIKKYDNLRFEKLRVEENSESDFEDMEEVALENLTADDELMARFKEVDNLNRSTSKSDNSTRNQLKSKDDEKKSRKERLLQVAPKLPFDVDLYDWEDEHLSASLLQPVSTESRSFWSAAVIEDSEGIPNPDGIANLRTRTIEFIGNFEPVKWSCRFPMSGGRLCPRKDRIKCPFHGKIVARDESGTCVNLKDRKKDLELQYKKSVEESQDTEILTNVKMATGIDLKLPKQDKRRRKRIDSELTDVLQEQDTVYRRLEKKLFNRRTMKRVAGKLDAFDQKRFRDKFGDQFQYVHKTT